MSRDEDPLRAFDELACCPSCAALSRKGTLRCPECGAFHMPIQDAEERIPEEARTVIREPEEPKDPEFYSIDPRGAIHEEHFEGDEDAVTDWKGASIDFGLEDDE